MGTNVSITPTLVLMAGLPGTGKSTLAYALAEAFDWIVIDKDLIHSAMISKGESKIDATLAAYEVALWLVRDIMEKQHRSVILDTAGRQPFILERAREMASQLPATLKIIRCIAPKDVRVNRLSTRERQPSQWAADFASDDEQESWYTHLPIETFVIQTEKPFDLYFEEAKKYLDSP